MEAKRICCFCETWESGGIESFLYNVLTHMDLRQIEVDIVAARLRDSVFTAELEKRGIRFYQLSGSPRSLGRNFRQFRLLLRERRYDVLHLNIFQGLALYYARVAKEEGVPIRIAHSHNTDLRKSGTRWLKLRLHRWAKKRYAGDAVDLWACSKAAAEFLFPSALLGERGFRFIPNGIDTERFRFDPPGRAAARAELGLDGKFVIGNIGRLCYQKNQEFLLEVFTAVWRRAPESRLLLVGGGEQRTALEQKAAALGIRDAVIFYGVSDHVERLLWAMDVFVLPSRFEGLPVTGVEAQASGVPCLFSDAITRECKAAETTAYLPLAAGPEAWADAILQAEKQEADRRSGISAVRKAGFDIRDVARLVEEHYMR